MKSKKSAKVLAITLAVAMLCTINAFAEEYDSGTVTHAAGGYTYNVYSSLYIDGNNVCRAGTWLSTDGYVNVPTSYMGACARLYKQGGGLINNNPKWSFNSSSTYFCYDVTNDCTYSGLVYSQGQIQLYTGTRYETYDAPQTTYQQSSLASMNATVNTLKATLDENGNYPTNANGETYGSGLLAQIVGAEPDLISAVGDNDVEGYVKAYDLNPHVSNPDEAAAYMATLNENLTIPLYDVNGTVIGTYTMSNPVIIPGSENMSLEEVQAAVEALGN